jgi:magnesium-transporting ATPase (P-type)
MNKITISFEVDTKDVILEELIDYIAGKLIECDIKLIQISNEEVDEQVSTTT